MTQLKVRCLGTFSAEFGGHPPIRFGSVKSQELLGYLVLKQDKTQSRELIAGSLWQNATMQTARKLLRTELWRLGRETALPNGQERLITKCGDSIRLNPDVGLWSDVEVVRHAYELLQARPIDAMSPAEVAQVEEAVRAYDGPLLPGWDHEWFLWERDVLHQMFVHIADKLIWYHESRCNYSAAISVALRVLREEPTREQSHQQLMRLHFQSGDPAAGLAQFERCVSVLRTRLGLRPSAGTLELYLHLRYGANTTNGSRKRFEGATEIDLIGERIAQLQRELDALRICLQRMTAAAERGRR